MARWSLKRTKTVLSVGILALCAACTLLGNPLALYSPSALSVYLKNVTSESARNRGFGLFSNTEHSALSIPGNATDQPLIDNFLTSNNVNPMESHWLREYAKWHDEQRRMFPDTELLTNPDAPPVLISYYDNRSEGLAGRFFFIDRLVWAAYRHHRVVLLIFYNTFPLETFLRPSHFFNWTVPLLPRATTTPEALTATYPDLIPTKPNNHRIVIMKKIDNHFKFGDKNETDAPFGVYWSLLFQPSTLLQETLEKTYQKLDLTPGNYYAIHCRILHPAHRKSLANNNALDKKGLTATHKWESHKKGALRTGIHAIQCSDWLAQQQQSPSSLQTASINTTSSLDETFPLPTYFFSDSQELVQAILNESNINNVSLSKIVGRYHAPVSHLESKNQPLEAILSTFVDLYMAMGARCITMGVGKFAYLAARISGTKCFVTHEGAVGWLSQKWGYKMVVDNVPKCPLPKIKV